MYKAILKCRVITPMFMAGADGITPELRPSEFKGMMCFWWRAIKAEKDIEKLREEEAKIFGGSGKGEGKSKVKIRIIPKDIKKEKYRRLPHSKDKTFKLNSFYPDSKFDIVLESYVNIKIFIDLSLISIVLGGFGKGARRGFGSIEILEPADLNFNNLNKKEELLKKIFDTLNQIEEHFIIKDSQIINTKEGGNYPWIKEIEIGKEIDDWEELLKKIGNASHNNKDLSLGSASPRMSSPIYVSIVRIKNKYYPVLTTLNSCFPKNHRYNPEKQETFKKEVLL